MIGVIGSGNLARALVRGWSFPVLLTDGGSGSAETLAAEVGGERCASNAELAERADVLVLCHKPYQLQEIAAEAAGKAKAVISTLARTSSAEVEQAFAGASVVRVMPSIAAELRKAVTVIADSRDSELQERTTELFEQVGVVVTLEERLLDVAAGIGGVGPAYVAAIVEAWVDSAVKHGLRADDAAKLAIATLAGGAALLNHHHADTLAVRRAVTSPGGITARGLAALDRAGLPAAFDVAMDAVLSK